MKNSKLLVIKAKRLQCNSLIAQPALQLAELEAQVIGFCGEGL